MGSKRIDTSEPAVANGEEAVSSSSHAVNNNMNAMATAVDEKRLVRKLDLHLIPLVVLLYLFSFLDR